MMSHYINTISPVTFCFVSSSHLRRLHTPCYNLLMTSTQVCSRNGAVAKWDKGYYLRKHQEISPRVNKVWASSEVRGMRDHPPSSYSLKMESFNTLLKANMEDKYESRPFTVGGYNWTLVVNPNGNKKDSGSGYLSLYVAIDNSTLVAAHQEVYADLRFYIFNKTKGQYFTIKGTDAWKFNDFKTMWGFSQVLSVNTFKDPKNGYLYDGDHCEFGVDVIIPSRSERSELFSATEELKNPRFTWSILGFSTLLKDRYTSDVFSVEGRSWYLRVNPSGHATGEGKALSLYLCLDANERLRPYEKIYARAKLRVLNQRQFNNVEFKLDSWFDSSAYCWGRNEFISLSDLKELSKGFVVNDVLKVQVEIEAISSTKYFPD